MVFIWVAVFLLALTVLIKGADYMLEGAERVGLSLGLSPFVVGVIIIGLGTSFPELVSSVVAVLQSETEIVAANAIGSNIANILLVVGISAVYAKKLFISKSLIDLDLPLLSISTFIFFAAVYDGSVTQIESLLLVATFIIYFLYTIKHQDETQHEILNVDLLPGDNNDTLDTDDDGVIGSGEISRAKIELSDITLLLGGIIMLVIGAKYLIDSVVTLAGLLSITTGVISLVAVAVGTSLPELLVSIKAAKKGRSEVVLGNIFGSNVFNLLIVVGVPGLFTKLSLDGPTLAIGLPALIITTVLFVISGISRRVHQWEGAMFLLLYIFFIGKLFGFL